MLVIVLADNLVFLYLGWEGVGFCSYALIGFWFDDEENADAGRKAFICTRIGDVGLGVALAILFLVFDSLNLSEIYSNVSVLTPGMATVIGLLLLWAALAKSAQLPLSVWLPDAMAGPTPVSALIHAATMVTAGVYLLARFFPLLHLSPTALTAVAAVGAVTTLYSALAALVQTDIKRILAYSTVSQVSYMFLAIGAGDIVGGMFLLLSHAFFKALLFLVAGCLIHALGGQQDIRRMGNIKRHLPGLYWLLLIGCLSLSAFPLIGGFFAKDRILLSVFLNHGWIFKCFWLMGLAGAILTPLYSMRLFFVVTRENSDGPQNRHLHQLPAMMTWVLWPLAVLSLLDGLMNLPVGPGKEWLAHFFSAIPGVMVEVEASAKLIWIMIGLEAVLVALAVLAAYHLFARPGNGLRFRSLNDFFFEGFYLDGLYDRVVLRPYQRLAAFLWTRVDENQLNHGYENFGRGLDSLSGYVGWWANGRLTVYLKMILLGFTVILLTWTIGWFLN